MQDSRRFRETAEDHSKHIQGAVPAAASDQHTAAAAALCRAQTAAPPQIQQQALSPAAAATSTNPDHPQPVSSRSGGRHANPAAWTSISQVTCALGRLCEGYCQGQDGRFRAARMSVHAVVKHKLYCSECQNIYCSTCKDNHSEAACQLTPKGSITEEQLLAAVSS